MILFINTAFAEVVNTTASSVPSMYGQLTMLVGFILIFWLLIWRPQSKRAKAHKNLLSNLTNGDEVVTTGGIIGKVVNTHDAFITLKVADSIELNFQKASVAASLPKGTIKAMQ